MKLLSGLVFLLLIMIATSCADTTWVASGNVSGLWNSSGSPFMVNAGDITVATGEALLINSGVKVYFAGAYKLVVNGLLQAIGTETDSIWFTGDPASFPYDSPTRWRGIRFVDADENCQLSYCSVSYSGATGAGALSYGGGLYCLNTDLHVEHSRIHHCHAGSPASPGGGCGAYFEQSDVLLEYTDITNNSATDFGDGVFYDTRAGGLATLNTTVHLRHCKVQSNHPGLSIGGIWFRAGTVATLDTCLIDDNQTPDGGYGGIVADPTSEITMTGTTISNHSPMYGSNGGLYCEAMTLTMDACTLRNNNASWVGPTPAQGGAGLAVRNPVSAVIRNSVFEGNRGDFGGALCCNNTLVTNCVFRNNISSNGAVCLNGGNNLIDCKFEDNEATIVVDVLAYNGDGVGGGLFFSSGTDSVRNCKFSGNFSTAFSSSENKISYHGGALYCDEDASPYVVNCLFSENNLNQFESFGTGSVLYNDNGSPTLEFCTMNDNDASGGTYDFGYGPWTTPGGVIYSDGGSIALKSCIISNSEASAGIRIVNSVTVDIHHSDFFGITGGNFAGSIPVGLGVISTMNANGDPCDEFYNIYLDPEYVDAVNGDLHLSNFSACIGGADPFSTVATDYENNARPLPSGSVRDMGAFESEIGGVLMAVEDLTIQSDEDQNDVVLRWGAVGAAQSYAVYSGEAQEYVPGLFTLIGTTADTFYVDSDVLLLPAMQRTYVVRGSVMP